MIGLLLNTAFSCSGLERFACYGQKALHILSGFGRCCPIPRLKTLHFLKVAGGGGASGTGSQIYRGWDPLKDLDQGRWQLKWGRGVDRDILKSVCVCWGGGGCMAPAPPPLVLAPLLSHAVD